MGYVNSQPYLLDPTHPETPLNQALAFVAYGVSVNNLTNQWLYIDSAGEWVPPYVSGRNIPLQGVQQIQAHFAAPPGFTSPGAISGQNAYLRATEQPLISTPGIPVAPGTSRWNIVHTPAVGVQASVTKAAVPGVIHIADFAHWSFISQAGAAGGNPGIAIRDGLSGIGAILFGSNLANSAVSSDQIDKLSIGPGLGIKGTAGNAMTIEFGVGIVNMLEIVDLVGYDQ